VERDTINQNCPGSETHSKKYELVLRKERVRLAKEKKKEEFGSKALKPKGRGKDIHPCRTQPVP